MQPCVLTMWMKCTMPLINESVRRTCAGAAAVRGQLQGHKKRCERQLWEVKWDRDVCVLSAGWSPGLEPILMWHFPSERAALYVSRPLWPRRWGRRWHEALSHDHDIKKNLFNAAVHAARIHVTSARSFPLAAASDAGAKSSKIRGNWGWSAKLCASSRDFISILLPDVKKSLWTECSKKINLRLLHEKQRCQ